MLNEESGKLNRAKYKVQSTKYKAGRAREKC